ESSYRLGRMESGHTLKHALAWGGRLPALPHGEAPPPKVSAASSLLAIVGSDLLLLQRTSVANRARLKGTALNRRRISHVHDQLYASPHRLGRAILDNNHRPFSFVLLVACLGSRLAHGLPHLRKRQPYGHRSRRDRGGKGPAGARS